MNNFFKKLEILMRKKHTFVLIVCFLFLVVIVSSIYSIVPHSSDEVSDSSSQSSSTENSSADTNEEEEEEEKFDYPISTMDPTDFTVNDYGVVSYANESSVGIDVSVHQGEIDWVKVKADGVDFAIIRVGYRGATEGGLVQDGNFIANIEGAIANNVAVGVYIYSQAISIEEAQEEAEFVMSLIEPYQDKIDYPVVFDWEHNSITDNRTDAMDGEDVSEFAKAFCETIATAGYTPMIYLNKSLGYNFYNLSTVNEYPIWIAEYEDTPSFYYEYEIWQYSDSGTINGISGDVDMNICFVDFE